MCSASAPTGWRTVVSGTAAMAEKGTSSYPTSERSRGMRSPASDAAFMTPYAIMSLKANTAVTPRPNSARAQAYPDPKV